MDLEQRKFPNILITGTPGCGKTTLASQVVSMGNATDLQLQHVDVSTLVKDQGLYTSYDEEWKTYDVDEDKTLDYIEQHCLGPDSQGGNIFDWHVCDVFAERWIDLVVVVRCNHTTLWDRLEKRKYPLAKIQENNEAEIMQVILDSAKESYAQEIIVELNSDTPDQVDQNTDRILEWIQAWRKNNDKI